MKTAAVLPALSLRLVGLSLLGLATAAPATETATATATATKPLPEGVVAAPRAEVPWTVAALAVPFEAPAPPEAWLLAALLDEPATWRGTAVGALLEVGGRLEASCHPDGLVFVVEGPARLQAQIVAAALALEGPGATQDALARAQARALRRRVLDESDTAKQARAALWRAWFGEGAPDPRLVVDEMQVIRLEPGALDALRGKLARAPGRALFVEGRIEAASLAEAGARLGHSGGATLDPRAPVPGAGRVVLQRPGAQRRLLLGHPLPPAPELDGPFGAALTEALRPTAAALGGTVELSLHRGAALLLFDLPLEGREADDAEAALKSALTALRQSPPPARALAPLLEKARASEAQERAQVGQAARALAARYLRAGAVAKGPETPEALRGLLRLALLPEALRAVLVEPSPLP